MMHGLPLAWAKFERKNVPGLGWRLSVTGQNDLVGGTWAESTTETQITFAEPGWYLVVVQTDTGRELTELELVTPTTWALNTMGRWRKAVIVQPINVVPAANGLTDPVVTMLNRQWQPHERVSMAWPIQTTTKNQAVKWRFLSGQTPGQHSMVAYVWRLADFAAALGPNTQDANRLLDAPQVAGLAVRTTEQPNPNKWYSPPYKWTHRITEMGSDPTNAVTWSPKCSHDYTHQLVVGYKCAVPNIVGFFRIKVFSQLGNVLANQRVSYKPTELEYSVALARRAANDRITTVEISEFDNGDLFDVWARLNVTD
jgi:hypothetical protein